MARMRSMPMALAFLFVFLRGPTLGARAGRIRNYKWEVKYQSWSPDCVQKEVIAINGEYPGPTIRARAGDTVVVELRNGLPAEGVVIHWHGIRQCAWQFGTPWSDGAAAVTQCPIKPGETYVYQFVVDRAGTFFYHAHLGMQRSAGLYGSLIVDVAEGQAEPFPYDGELSILVSDWWHASIAEQAKGLSSIPFRWIGEPQSLLVQGRGRYNCSLLPSAGDGEVCDAGNPQCSPFVLPVEPGKTYRLRIASITSLSSLNFLLEGHNMTIVEADGSYVEAVEVANLDIYTGQSYSVLVSARADPTRNYWAAVNVRGRRPGTPAGLAVLNYRPNPPSAWPSTSPPRSPGWDDYAYSVAFSRQIVARNGSPRVPPKSERTLVLLNTQNLVRGYTRWATNNVSLVLPATPYLAALKLNLRNAVDPTPPPDKYGDAGGYDIARPPANPNASLGSGFYALRFNSTVDVVLQNSNVLSGHVSEIHPWHLHGHDFWVLGYGDGKFRADRDAQKFNVANPPLRNTVAVFPYGWTAVRFVADNPGAWIFHCHVEPHLFMGMGVVFAEGVERVGVPPASALGCASAK